MATADDYQKAAGILKMLGNGGTGANYRPSVGPGNMGGGGRVMSAAQLLQQADQIRTQAQKDADWDKMWRPVEQILNTLTAAGSGTINMVDKGIKAAVDGDTGYLMSSISPAFGAVTRTGIGGSFMDGLNASLQSDTESPNYMYGSKAIENITDAVGNKLAPRTGYVDVEDNVNPVGKAVGGFVGDVLLDPLTYVPGGIVASAGRGGIRAAKAAETGSKLSAAIKGIKVGTEGAGEFAVGRFTSRPKPVGFDQWKQVRDFDKVEQIGRRAGIPSEALFANTAEELAEIATRNGDDAADYLAKIAEQGDELARRLPNAKTIWDGTGQAGIRASKAARAATRMAPEGASEYLHGARNPQRPAHAGESPIPQPAGGVPGAAAAARQGAQEAGMAAESTAARQTAPDLEEQAFQAVQEEKSAERAYLAAQGYGEESINMILDRVDLGRPTTRADKLSQAARKRNITDGSAATLAARKVEAARATDLVFDDIRKTLESGVSYETIVKKMAQEGIDPGEADEILGELSQTLRLTPKNGPKSFFNSLTRENSRSYNTQELASVIRSLGLDPHGLTSQGEMISLLRTRGPQQYDRAKQANQASVKAIRASVMPSGDEISALAENTVPGRAVGQFAETVDQEIITHGGGGEAGQAYLDAVNGIAMRGIMAQLKRAGDAAAKGTSRQGLKYGKVAPGVDSESWIYTQTHVQQSVMTQLRAARAEIKQMAPKNDLSEWRIERDVIAAMRKQELQMGIVSVTSLGKKFGNIYKPVDGAEFDAAFLHLDDVYRALDQGLLQDLRVTHRMPGKLPTYVDGKPAGTKDVLLDFPPTVIQGAALMALKLDAENPAQLLARLSDYIYREVDSIPGYKQYGVTTNKASKSLADQLAVALSNPKVLAALHESNIRNGAVAVAMGQESANRIAAPVRAALDKVMKGLTSTTGDKVDAIQTAVNTLRGELKKLGLANELDARIAMADFQAYTAKLLDPASMFVARTASRTARIQQVDSAGTPLSKADVTARRETIEAVNHATNPVGAKTLRNPPAVKPTEARKKTLRTTGGASPAMNAERADLAESLIPHANQIAEDTIRYVDNTDEAGEAMLEFGAEVAANEIMLRELLDLGKMSKVGRAMSGKHGQQDTKAFAVQQQVLTQQDAGNFEKWVRREFRDRFPAAQLDGWFTRFIRAAHNEDVARIISELPADQRDDALRFWDEAVSPLFDHSISNLFARTGLDSDWINDFLKLTPLGAIPGYYLNGKTMGWEIGNVWKAWEKIGEEGGAHAMDIIESYSWAVRNAALIPNVAAGLSANFGARRGLKMTEEAIAKGLADGSLVKLKSGPESGKLARFLDPDDVYPRVMADQMANTEAFLEYALKLGTDNLSKIIRASDRVVGAVKASITLWRPGHHVVNIMGEALMNMLAGVTNPARYGQALAVLRAGGDLHTNTVFGHNYQKALDDVAHEYGYFDDAGELIEGAHVNARIGGNKKLGMNTIYQLVDRGGILINHNTAEDLRLEAGEFVTQGTAFQRTFRPFIKATEGLGQMSASRDNIFRVAHFIDILEKKSFRTIEDAMDYARREIYDYHPTMQTLSGFEQKWARRILYFYTWQRQALTKILESLIENPARVTMPVKANFEASTIGGDPESMGHPMPNDERLPGFASRNILGPHWYDENGDIQGIALNAPQLDILQSIFGGLEFNPDMPLNQNLAETGSQFFRENTIGMLSPALKVPIETLWQTKSDGNFAQPIRDQSDYLVDQTGLGYLSRLTSKNLLNNDGLFGTRADAVNDTPEEQQKTQIRTLVNAITGLKWNTPSDYADTAYREQADELQRMLDAQNRNIFGNALPDQ